MHNPLLRLTGIPLVAVLVLSSFLSTNHVIGNNPSFHLSEGDLFEKYVSLSTKASHERPQSMRVLSSAERNYFWRIHLGLYFAQHSTLSSEQQQVITETLLAVSRPSLSAQEHNNSVLDLKASKPIVELRQRGLQVFSREEVEQIFSEVGGAQEGELLETYTEFSKLAKANRKARFNQISSREKSQLWRTHLGLNLARHPEWTNEQRSIVLEAIGIARSELYETKKDENWTRLVDEPLYLFSQRALLLFSKEEAATLFSELGGNEPKAHHYQKGGGGGGNCSCSRQSDWCSNSCSGSDCTLLTWGCGTMGVYSCNGACYVPLNN